MHYSGTVAAAREANICGLPSIALSMAFLGATDFYYHDCAQMAVEFIDEVLERIEEEKELFSKMVFNVNFPNVPREDNRGWRFVYQGNGIVRDELTEQSSEEDNGLQKIVFVVRSFYHVNSTDIDIDSFAVKKNFTAVTAIPLFSGKPPPFEQISSWSIFGTKN